MRLFSQFTRVYLCHAFAMSGGLPARLLILGLMGLAITAASARDIVAAR